LELKLTDRTLAVRIAAAPPVHDSERARSLLADLTRRCGEVPELAALGARIAAPPVRDLLAGIFGRPARQCARCACSRRILLS
jgi:hypothetical protein